MKSNNKRHANRKFTVTAFALLLVLAVLFAACTPVEKSDADNGSGGGQASSGGSSGDAAPAPEAADVQAPEQAAAPVADSGAADIVIPLADVTTTATFYPATVNGIDLEVIAVEAPDGTIRTAFNTCQVCYDSGKGYYEQDGDVLVCQNCGNRFPMSHVEVESGGCNPWPIFDEYKTVTDTDITIPAAFLAEATVIFENWKRNY
ncbi:MAG: DUF2318 domain-containing protein [Clostridiales Family XIII bacterium]|jgi:hypothetical protein|nr:DUF2318 domain-containing protein [Clostridiales Family XIII bacterium]